LLHGKGCDRLTLTNHKTLLARSDAVLIDDQQATVCKFIAAGGLGVVFPSRHNDLYAMADDPVPYVVAQLKEHVHALQVS